jgi:hypothetical protein
MGRGGGGGSETLALHFRDGLNFLLSAGVYRNVSAPSIEYKTEQSGLRRRMSSGMLRRVALVRTDVSKKLSAPFIRVTRIDELETLAVTRNNASQRVSVASYS